MDDDNRESLLHKVCSLLAKTTENGCTESEALAALDRAQAMIQAYEIADEELALTEKEKAIIRQTATASDRHDIRRSLSSAIAGFTGTECWSHRTFLRFTAHGRAQYRHNVVFAGLRADVDFAEYLLDALETFVRAELTEYLIAEARCGAHRTRLINGFVNGCTWRICERLRALTTRSKTAATGNQQALVVVKDAAIKQAMDEAGIRLRSGRMRPRVGNVEARDAGRKAGERAGLGRPIETGEPTLLAGRKRTRPFDITASKPKGGTT